jgi:sulfonate transport system substrate-binding protein
MISRRDLLQTSGFAAAAALSGCKKDPGPVTLTLGDQKGGMQSLMELSGDLSNLDYSIQWAQFAAAAPLFEALNAGAIDAGVGGDAPFVFFLASKPAAQAIAALNYTAAAPDTADILVKPDSGLHSIQDLVGKRVAVVRGSTGQYITLAALQRAGLPLDAVTFTFLEPSDSLTTLLNSGVDAWGTWEPYVSIGELHYGLRPLRIPSDILAGLGFIVATNQAIGTKHAALQDFLARFTRARAWSAANVGAYAAGFAKDTGLPIDVAQAYARKANYAVMPIDARRIAGVQQLTDLYAAARLLPASFVIDSAFNQSFFAQS